MEITRGAKIFKSRMGFGTFYSFFHGILSLLIGDRGGFSGGGRGGRGGGIGLIFMSYDPIIL